MYALYERFLQQVKAEQIDKYNKKHRDYLIRSGKMKDEKPPVKTMRNQNKSAVPRPKRQENNQQNEEIVMTKPVKAIAMDTGRAAGDDRPLKGAQSYNFDANEQIQDYQPKPAQQRQPPRFNPPKQREQPIKPFVEAKRQPVEQPMPKMQERPKAPDLNELSQFPQEQDIVLVECPMNCGRKFNEKAIDKHIKICQKGEKKRKVFKVKVVDEEAEQLKKDEPKADEKKTVIPKWKKESNQLRIGLQSVAKAGEGGAAVPVEEPIDDRTMCPGCGRKFNEQAAEKHIPSCVKRNKGKGK